MVETGLRLPEFRGSTWKLYACMSILPFVRLIKDQEDKRQERQNIPTFHECKIMRGSFQKICFVEPNVVPHLVCGCLGTLWFWLIQLEWIQTEMKQIAVPGMRNVMWASERWKNWTYFSDNNRRKRARPDE